MDTTMQIVPKYKEQLLMYTCHMGRRWYTSDPNMLTYNHLSHQGTTLVYRRRKKKNWCQVSVPKR
jgi:hypothetical protein